MEVIKISQKASSKERKEGGEEVAISLEAPKEAKEAILNEEKEREIKEREIKDKKAYKLYKLVKDHPEGEKLAQGVPGFPYSTEGLDLLVSILDKAGEEATVNVLETTTSYTQEGGFFNGEGIKRDIIYENYSLTNKFSDSSKLPELIEKYNKTVMKREHPSRILLQKTIPIEAEIDKINSTIEKVSSRAENIEDVIELCDVINEAKGPQYEPQKYLSFLGNLDEIFSNAEEYSKEILKLISSYEGEERFIIADVIKRKSEAKSGNNKKSLKRLLYALKSDSIFNLKNTLNEKDRQTYLRNLAEIAGEIEERKSVEAITETAQAYSSRELKAFMENMKEIAQATKDAELVEKIAKESKYIRGKELEQYMSTLKDLSKVSSKEALERVIDNYTSLNEKERSTYLKQMRKIGENLSDKSLLEEIANLPEHDIREKDLKKRLKEIRRNVRKADTPYETKNLVDAIKMEEGLKKQDPIFRYTKNPALQYDIQTFSESLGRKENAYINSMRELARTLNEKKLDTNRILGALNDAMKELKRKGIRGRTLARIVKSLNKFTKKHNRVAPAHVDNAIYETMAKGLQYISKKTLFDADPFGIGGLGNFLNHYFKDTYVIGANAFAPIKPAETNKKALEKVLSNAENFSTMYQMRDYLEAVKKIAKQNIYNPEGLEALGSFAANVLRNEEPAKLAKYLSKIEKKSKKYAFFNVEQLERMVKDTYNKY